MTEAELLECATRFYLGDHTYLERDGGGWAIRYERAGTMNPYYLNSEGQAWQYKNGTRFRERDDALACLGRCGRRSAA